MKKVFVGLGSNLGDRKKHIINAINRINACKGMSVVNKSGFYETKPVGGPSQPDFINCVLELKTGNKPHKLLKEFKEIEFELGRRPGVRWGSRVIDIDILLYENEVVKVDDLKIPHENMHERFFVLEPLCEISPESRHPVLKKTIHELLEKLRTSKK